MKSDKLSFFQKTKLNIAKSVAPVKEKSTVTLSGVDFFLAPPTFQTIHDYDLHTTSISSNYCFSPSNITITSQQINIEAHLEGAHSPFIRVSFPPLLIRDLGDIQDILNHFPEIENFGMKLKRPAIRGKIYSREVPKEAVPKPYTPRMPQQENQAPDEEHEQHEPIPVIEQHYRDKNKFDAFDVFDLIFPALQPPLGKNFDNPIVFPRPLLAFQPEGIEFLLDNPSALLGDEMGLGKTIQAIVALKVLFATGKISTCCIVCPKALLTNWYNELIRWAPELKSLKLAGGRENRKLLWQTGAHVYICVYESLQKDLENTIELKALKVDEQGHHFKCVNTECGKEIDIPFAAHYTDVECPHCKYQFFYPLLHDRARTHFDVLIFDEIQKTKNPKTKMTKAARTLYAKYKWALSGTPMENKLKDLVTVCETLEEEMFKDVDKRDTQEVIKRYRPKFIRRKKDDVLKDLQPIQSKYEWLELSPSQRRKYDHAEATGILDLEGKDDVTVHHIFALITKLKQLCNIDPETQESSKLEYLKEKLLELTSQGDKALVFSQFPKKTLEPLLPHLKEFHPLYYHGGLNLQQREAMVRSFQDANNTMNKIMLISLKAGNSGITLTRANYVFHFDLWWNPAISSQAAGRAHRIGQEKTVFETMLLAEDTIERRIFDILESKKSLFNIVVDELSEEVNLDKLMSEDELFGLFGLKKRRAAAAPIDTLLPSNLHALDEEAFERLVSELFTKMGYHLNHHKKTYDGGVYLHAKIIRPSGISEVMIQPLMVSHAQEVVPMARIEKLVELKLQNKKISKAFLVTNGIFATEGLNFAKDRWVELINGEQLNELIKK